MSLSDKDYQKKLDVQIAYWDKLKNEIQKVRSGENGTADLVDMSETYFQMADETVAAVKVSHANRQLEQKAYIDLHTGLPNKSKCEELFHNVEFIKTPTACIVFDMNNLKPRQRQPRPLHRRPADSELCPAAAKLDSREAFRRKIRRR